MQRYSPERKEVVLRKMAPPHNMTVPDVIVYGYDSFCIYIDINSL